MTPREAFLAERLTGIGGSDVHHLFGLDPYGCARRLYYEKSADEPDYPVDESGPMRRGNLLEPIIAAEYAEATGRSVETRPQLRHPEFTWAVVHVDRIVDGDRVLEIKSVGPQVFSKIKRDGLPEAYILQLQHGMFVTGLKQGAFAIHEPVSWKLIHFDVERDEELIEQIKVQGAAFWDEKSGGVQPNRLEPTAIQCQSCPYRTSCQGTALLDSVQKPEDGDVPMVYELRELVESYAEVRGLAAEAEEMKDAAKDALADAIGTRTAIDVPGYRVHYRPQTSLRLNEAKVKKLVEDYNRVSLLVANGKPSVALRIDDLKAPSVSRPLRIYAR